MPRSPTRVMSSLKQHAQAGNMPRAYMTLLQRRPKQGKEKHTNDLHTKFYGSSPGGTRSLHLHSINADHPSARPRRCSQRSHPRGRQVWQCLEKAIKPTHRVIPECVVGGVGTVVGFEVAVCSTMPRQPIIPPVPTDWHSSSPCRPLVPATTRSTPSARLYHCCRR